MPPLGQGWPPTPDVREVSCRFVVLCTGLRFSVCQCACSRFRMGGPGLLLISGYAVWVLYLSTNVFCLREECYHLDQASLQPLSQQACLEREESSSYPLQDGGNPEEPTPASVICDIARDDGPDPCTHEENPTVSDRLLEIMSSLVRAWRRTSRWPSKSLVHPGTSCRQ